MRQFVRLLSACSLLVLGASVGPVAHAQTAAGQSEETGSSSEAAERAHHGMNGLFEEALGDVQLKPEQKTAVDQLTKEFKARHEPVRAARHEFLKALADHLEKGTIDRCALAPRIDAVAAAKEQARPADRAAFEQLHQILAPEQRAQFVESVRRLHHERVEKHDSGKWLDKAAETLSLSADQKAKMQVIFSALKQIRDVEPGYLEHKQTWHKILEAFKTDRFVLDEIAPAHDVAAKSKARAERMLSTVELALPLLTPEQRALAAQKIREHVSHPDATGEAKQSETEADEMGE